MKPGTYMIFDYQYDQFVEENIPGSETKFDLVGLIKKEGYKVAGFPFFEFLPETDNQKIRVYIPIQ